MDPVFILNQKYWKKEKLYSSFFLLSFYYIQFVLHKLIYLNIRSNGLRRMTAFRRAPIIFALKTAVGSCGWPATMP